MAKGSSELLGRLLIPFADFSSVDDHIVLIALAINPDRSKRE
jgi:hypothetical protein